MLELRPFIPVAILGAGCALLLQSKTQDAMPLTRPLSAIMDTAAGYRVVDQRLSEEEQRVAGMSSYVARAYVRDSSVAFTTLVSYYDRQTQGKTIHSPRNCLPGAGWEIMTGGTRTVAVDGVTHTVNRYVLRNGSSTALAYYWYQGRGRITANEYRVKWNLLRDAAFKGHTEEALVRIVVPISAAGNAGGSAEERASIARAENLATGVAKRLVHEVDGVLPGSGSP